MKTLDARENGLVVALGARAIRLSAGAAAALLVLAGLGVGAVSYVAADQLVHPDRELRRVTPAARGLDFERVSLTTVDGLELRGWWIPAEGARGTVLFLHGYGASKAQSLSVAPFLVRAGYHVLAFDFRAHGESAGTYTTVGLEEAKDVRAAVAYALSRSEAPVALFGWSMGAAAAINAAPDLPEVRAIVADSSFAHLSTTIGANLDRFTGLPEYPFVPLITLFMTQMAGHDAHENEPARSAASAAMPLLVIQGTRDDIASTEDGRTLASAAGELAELWLVDGAGHVDARRANPREYEARVLAFLDQRLSG